MGYQLITSSHTYPLFSLSEMPEKARRDFDYVEDGEEHTPRFFKYRGAWIDAHDAQQIEPDNGIAHRMGWAMRVHPGEPLARFDAVMTDTYFSGMAWRFVDDGESVRVCRFYW